MASERQTQDRIVNLLTTELPYQYLGNLQYRDDNDNIINGRLSAYLRGRGYAQNLIDRAITQLRATANEAGKSLYARNHAVYQLLRYGVKLKPAPGEPTETVHLIDWAGMINNDFYVAEEVTYRGRREKRPDVVMYVNGIALAVLELKRASNSLGDGIRQSIRNQEPEFIEDFFTTVQFVLAGNDSKGLRYGTTNTRNKWFLEWKEDEEDSSRLKIDKHLLQLFAPLRLLELVRDFVVFDGGVKKLPRPHQYFGTKAAQIHVRRHEGGIIWHTQGSGKSLVMVMLARWILSYNPEARVVVLTDRTELDKQISDVFQDSGEKIARTTSGRQLMNMLLQPTPRLLCSLVHKFGKRDPARDFEEYLEELRHAPRQPYGDLFVFVDECHRTQSGKLHRAVKAALPNATFIGFTGTPLLKKDKQTSQEVFGTYIHTYKYNEAVRDGIVKDLAYEARDVDQRMGSPERVDEWFAGATNGLNDFQRGKLKKQWATMRQVLSSKGRIEKIVADIGHDFRTRPRLANGRGNAILVARGIYEACRYYEAFNQRGSALRGKCAVVTSYDPRTRDIVHEATGDELDTQKEFIYEVYTELLRDVKEQAGQSKTEVYEEEVKELLKHSPQEMKLLVVVDKLLTGFDAPPCTYLYIDKRMQDHGLFQAITRVNRLDTEDKLFGHIIDYKGLFVQVAGAMSVYTEELDSEQFDQAAIDIQLKTRLELGREKLDAARERVKLILEPVQPPYGTLEHIRYFVGNSESPEDIGRSKPQREQFYKSFVTYFRAYASLSDSMQSAGYSDEEIATIKREIQDYLDLREVIRQAAGETFDGKAYEGNMRYLIDNYINADEARKLHDFGNQTLLDLIEAEGLDGALGHLPSGIRDSPEAMAETIENNVRRKIIKEHHLDPTYFDEMSSILAGIIEERRQGVTDYAEAMRRVGGLAGKVNEGNKSDVPDSLQRPEQRALFGLLNRDEPLALRVDTAIRVSARADWRGNPAKERELKAAIYQVINDVEEVNRIFDFVRHQPAY